MTKEPSWLARAAHRARTESWSLGRLLSDFCALESISEDDLAEQLSCTPATLRWLFVCRVPTPARFAEDVELIAQRFALNGHGLAALIRRADALIALTTSAEDSGPTELLLAARDREPEEDQ
jgi:hypothetical protein